MPSSNFNDLTELCIHSSDEDELLENDDDDDHASFSSSTSGDDDNDDEEIGEPEAECTLQELEYDEFASECESQIISRAEVGKHGGVVIQSSSISLSPPSEGKAYPVIATDSTAIDNNNENLLNEIDPGI